jgi:hypothetical protein
MPIVTIQITREGTTPEQKAAPSRLRIRHDQGRIDLRADSALMSSLARRERF